MNLRSFYKDSETRETCIKIGSRGTWLAQSVKLPTLDLSSGHDLMVCEFEPLVGLCADSSEPGARFGFCVSLFLCPSPTHAPSLPLSEINIKK